MLTIPFSQAPSCNLRFSAVSVMRCGMRKMVSISTAPRSSRVTGTRNRYSYDFSQLKIKRAVLLRSCKDPGFVGDTRWFAQHASQLRSVSPNPTKTHTISPISEGGETGSRGHVSVQLVCRPGQSRTPPPVACGGPQGTVPLPMAGGLTAPSRSNKNVELGLGTHTPLSYQVSGVGFQYARQGLGDAINKYSKYSG